jgi:hypothetical protein
MWSLRSFELMKRRLYDTTTVRVIEGQGPFLGDSDGVFSPIESVVYLKHNQLSHKHLHLHHECVHITTHRAFIRNPSPWTAAPLLNVCSHPDPLSKELPSEYQRQFQLDEIIAYQKTSAYLEVVSKQPRRVSRLLSAMPISHARHRLIHSWFFIVAARKVLAELRTVLEWALSGDELDVEAAPYPNPQLESNYVLILVPIRSGPNRLEAVVPIYLRQRSVRRVCVVRLDPEMAHAAMAVCTAALTFVETRAINVPLSARGYVRPSIREVLELLKCATTRRARLADYSILERGQ